MLIYSTLATDIGKHGRYNFTFIIACLDSEHRGQYMSHMTKLNQDKLI